MVETEMSSSLVQVKGLKKYFRQRPSFLEKHFAKMRPRVIKAVDGIDLTLYKGETLGLVGESGSGKSTLGRTLVGLYSPTAGEIVYRMNGSKSRPPVQMIFQNPYSSLNPRHSVRQILGTALAQRGVSFRERERETLALLKRVGLEERHLDQYPRQFSGGQRQRIAVARALAVQPEFIVADEPLSSLDVSVQAQVVNLLEDLQAEMGLTYLLISHDLSVVYHLSRRIAVMYSGKIVEMAPSRELFHNPLHPYTQTLLSAIPRIGEKGLLTRGKLKERKTDGERGGAGEKRAQGHGDQLGHDLHQREVTLPESEISLCRFWDRCPMKMPICEKETAPPIIYGQSGEPGMEHVVFCHKFGE